MNMERNKDYVEDVWGGLVKGETPRTVHEKREGTYKRYSFSLAFNLAKIHLLILPLLPL